MVRRAQPNFSKVKHVQSAPRGFDYEDEDEDMRRKAFPVHRKSLQKAKRTARRAYVISSRAQDVLVAIVEGILEESLEDAQRLAGIQGKTCVSREEMEQALANLCLRLNPLSDVASKLKIDQTEDVKPLRYLGNGAGDGNGDGDADKVDSVDKKRKYPEGS